MNQLNFIHSDFLVEQVARIIHFHEQRDPKLINPNMDDEWMAYSDQEKVTFIARAHQWLDRLWANHASSYEELKTGIIPPEPKF